MKTVQPEWWSLNQMVLEVRTANYYWLTQEAIMQCRLSNGRDPERLSPPNREVAFVSVSGTTLSGSKEFDMYTPLGIWIEEDELEEQERIECPVCHLAVLEDEFVPAEDDGPGMCLCCLNASEGW